MDRETIATYELVAQDYDRKTADFWERFPKTCIYGFYLNIHQGKVLDLGSGPGRDGLILKENGLDVVCLDAAKNMTLLSHQKGLDTIRGDFLTLPFKSGSFGGVWAYTSLIHIQRESLSNALEEVNRVLKKGGILGLGMYEGEGETIRHYSEEEPLPRHFTYHSTLELNQLLTQSGFQIYYFELMEAAKHKNLLNFLARKIN
ncbi:class I SAM-dependent methyltransferase [Candidatus Daviesbacteria bacterium]|nr:class I SAM-dependent methyltransferase [Candidatus Daviesbacteria bacterium]